MVILGRMGLEDVGRGLTLGDVDQWINLSAGAHLGHSAIHENICVVVFLLFVLPGTLALGFSGCLFFNNELLLISAWTTKRILIIHLYLVLAAVVSRLVGTARRLVNSI